MVLLPSSQPKQLFLSLVHVTSRDEVTSNRPFNTDGHIAQTINTRFQNVEAITQTSCHSSDLSISEMTMLRLISVFKRLRRSPINLFMFQTIPFTVILSFNTLPTPHEHFITITIWTDRLTSSRQRLRTILWDGEGVDESELALAPQTSMR